MQTPTLFDWAAVNDIEALFLSQSSLAPPLELPTNYSSHLSFANKMDKDNIDLLILHFQKQKALNDDYGPYHPQTLQNLTHLYQELTSIITEWEGHVIITATYEHQHFQAKNYIPFLFNLICPLFFFPNQLWRINP